MTPAITDEHVVRVLRLFVHGTRPVLDALRDSDPFGLRQRMIDNLAVAPAGAGPGAAAPVEPDAEERGVLSGAKETVLNWVSAVKVPGTPAWAAMDAERRTDWWVSRVGRFVALLAAVPGLGGALSDRLPVQDSLGAAGQGLLLCAIAGEHGIRSDDDQIRLLAAVLFERTVDAALATAPEPPATEEVDELTGELAQSEHKHGRITLRAVAATVWRMGRVLWSLGDELGKRPQGRWYHKLLGMLPVVGMAGDYLGERSALRRVATAARRWIADNERSSG